MPSGNPHIILIDGKSGVGKSSLAQRMAASLGATVVHLDDSYPGWGGLEAGRDAIIESVIVPVSVGQRGEFRAWDWARDCPGENVTVNPSDVVIVEGCGISTPRSRDLSATVLWLECPEEVRAARLLGRDGTDFASQYEDWDTQVDAHIAQNDPIATASVIVRT